jgi:hypothetical protein
LFSVVLPVIILYFNRSNPFYYFSLPFSLYPVLFNSFQCDSLYLIPTQLWCISILFTLYNSFLLFILP